MTTESRPTRMGANGFLLIRRWEGCSPKAYPDPGSADGHPWTIGYGHTGPEVRKGVVWTQQQCEDRLAADLRAYENAVRNAIGEAATTQNQFDAMVALCFNIGIKAFTGSTVLREHESGDHEGAALAFRLWKKNNGKVMRGLVNRRAAEEALYRKATA